MEIGALRERVEIQVRGQVQDELGEPVTDWTVLRTVWAAVKPVGGRSFYAAKAVRSEVPVRIVMRRAVDVTTAHRIVHRGHIYEIEAVQDWPKEGLTVLLCREVVA